MDAGFSIALPYQAAPFVWGSVQDASQMTLIYQGVPFLVLNQPPGAVYTLDSLGRLTQITFTNQTTVVFNYDHMGNRTSVVTTAGPHGL
jgi:YD repeat-containing protein